MALNLYRRHRKECEGSHPEDTRTGQFEEGRRGWKKCACLIHVSGTLGGKFSRRQTGTADWDEAKAIVALLQQSGSWDGQGKIEQMLTLPATDAEPERISVIRAIAAFTAEFEEHTAPNTQRNYKFVLKELRGVSDAKGYVAIDQVKATDLGSQTLWEFLGKLYDHVTRRTSQRLDTTSTASAYHPSARGMSDFTVPVFAATAIVMNP